MLQQESIFCISPAL